MASSAVVLLATWMGLVNGGYFVGDWTLVALILAVLTLILSLGGVFRDTGSAWSASAAVASGLLAAFTAWTLASLLWSPNKGDAWVGSGITILYLLTFWATVLLIGAGASRRWILSVSVLGPATIAAFTLLALAPHYEDLFSDHRLIGSVGYYNGEAAFLLIPFWIAVYLGGSRRISPIVRGLVLAGVVLSVAVAVLTQSRGAMVALVISAFPYFLFSGQRLRGLLALVPAVTALIFTFPGLNDVYVQSLNQGDPIGALTEIDRAIWVAAAGAGVYGISWGLIDKRWQPSARLVRAAGGIVLVCSVVILIIGGTSFTSRTGSPITWGEQKWEAFRTDDLSGQDQSRFVSASGSGRYILWEVAWEDFVTHPVLGVGTHNYEATYYQLREEALGSVRQPHMLPLEVLSERGLVGGVLFFGFLAACVGGGLIHRFRRLSTEGKAQVGAVTAAVTYWFIHSSAEWFWQIPAVTMPAIVYLAMLVAPWHRTEADSRLWPLQAAGSVIAVIAVIIALPLFLGDFYSQRSESAEDPRVALRAIERAQVFNPLDPGLPQREAELAIEVEDWSRVRDSYSQAIRLNPEHYGPYYLLGLFNEKLGEREEALRLYRKASTLNPLDEEIERHISQLEDR